MMRNSTCDFKRQSRRFVWRRGDAAYVGGFARVGDKLQAPRTVQVKNARNAAPVLEFAICPYSTAQWLVIPTNAHEGHAGLESGPFELQEKLG